MTCQETQMVAYILRLLSRALLLSPLRHLFGEHGMHILVHCATQVTKESLDSCLPLPHGQQHIGTLGPLSTCTAQSSSRTLMLIGMLYQ